MTEEKELLKVKEAVNYYADGAIKRDFEYLAKSWHEKCQMIGLNQQSELAIYDLNFWKEGLAKPIASDVKRTSEILSIDIHGVAASAKVKTIVDSSESEIIFIDYLNLLKIDGKWWIVNKIWDTTVNPKK
jgi:hypothetical protein